MDPVELAVVSGHGARDRHLPNEEQLAWLGFGLGLGLELALALALALALTLTLTLTFILTLNLRRRSAPVLATAERPTIVKSLSQASPG